jgi:FlaA1/EpsC-like NDP-sugar epimerase
MRLIEHLLTMQQRHKQVVVLAVDMTLALLATWLAFSLRLERYHFPVNDAQWIAYAITAVLFVPIFIRLGLYRAIFRYSGIASLRAVAQAVFLYGVVLFVALVFLRLPGVPRSLGILQPILFWGFVSFSRILASQLLLKRYNLTENGRRPTLIYGAGNAGAQAASSLTISGQSLVVGFVDDDVEKQGKRLNGLDVHARSDIPDLIERFGVTDVLLALSAARLAERRAIVASLEPYNVRVRSIPEFSQLAIGQATFSDVEELRIVDLLARDPLATPFTGTGLSTVIVTGAGGSIGSELCRQLLGLKLERLVLVDHNEFGLYRIHAEMTEAGARKKLATRVVAHLASVRDEDRMDDLVALYRPDAIYHAAAYKHVPLIEHDPIEGVTNNVLGTLNMASIARRHGVPRFVLISTDKAVRPTNVMGATKRMAEMIVQALAAEGAPAEDGRTIYSMVRFGNVLDSSGSVVPLFRRQIREGGPVTITDPDVTRYFMTIPEAVSLVLQAGQMAEGGEVFVLDMGEPVRIIDLARRMIRLSGRTERTADNPAGDIEIRTIGLRPGEKLYEELLIGESPLPTINPSILKAHEKFLSWQELDAVIGELRAAAEANDAARCVEILRIHVSGFQPDGCED